MRRVVLKVGSSSLTNAQGIIDCEKLRELADAARAAKSLGIELAIVSSGAVAAGFGLLLRGRPRTLPEKQAYAAVGQAELMRQWSAACAPFKVAQFLLSSDDIHSRTRFINAKQALEATFKLGVLPILNENDTIATAELRLGDNDTLSAWVAYLIGADTLMLLTDVDGLYSTNPRLDPGALKQEVVRDVRSVLHFAGAAGSTRGTGGMRTKLSAALIASDAGIDTIILSGGGAAVQRSLRGEAIGTRIFATGKQVDCFKTKIKTSNPYYSAKHAWILHQPERGQIEIDTGALVALRAGKSLLPGGIIRVAGDFNSGDAVAICSAGEKLAKGLSNFNAIELARIAGRRSDQVEAILGEKRQAEAIHRNQLVLTPISHEARLQEVLR
jgi:glutamate 5-kinase